MTRDRLATVSASVGPAGAVLEEWRSPVDFVLGPSAFARTAVVAIDLPHGRVGIGRHILR